VIDAGLLIDTGVLGVYGRGRDFEAIRRAVNDAVSRAAEPDDAEPVRFPPVLPREQFEKSGYLSSFPHLAGTVFDFEGDEDAARVQHERAAAHEDWSEFQTMSDLVLTPAACYPVYPAIAARGPLPPGGLVIDAGDSYVFRSEPSGDPARLQMFHQREIVRIGEPEAVAEWRNTWRDRAMELLRGLGLAAEYDVASDPFFGRSGRMMAASQRQQELKFEILVQIAGPEPTAVASFNYHQLHFAETYGITLANGETAHTSCLGFGLERITLALLNTHGLDPAAWPADVRAKLFES
jgi:seryl-tRNA synthetase